MKRPFQNDRTAVFCFHGSVLSSAAAHFPPRERLSKYLFVEGKPFCASLLCFGGLSLSQEEAADRTPGSRQEARQLGTEYKLHSG